MLRPGQLYIGDDGMPKTALRNDDLVSACRYSASLREEEISEEESSRRLLFRSWRREQHPYPVDASDACTAADNAVDDKGSRTKVDFAAQFRAARARVAEEERKVETDALNKAARSITKMDEDGKDEEGSTVVVSEATPITPHSCDNADVTLLCARLAISIEDLSAQSTLRADHRRLGVPGARSLAALFRLGALRALKVLTLAQNSLTDMGVAILVDAIGPSTPLTHLDLASNSFAGAGASAVARALGRGALPSLVTLSLKNNDIDSEGLQAIARVTHGTLNWLNLSGNQISDVAPLTDALRAGGLPSLRRLALDHNLLDDGPMRALATALATPTEAGLARLGLDELYVEHNAAGEEATQAVQDYFLLDEEDEAVAGKRVGGSAREVCETVSVSLYRCLGGGGQVAASARGRVYT